MLSTNKSRPILNQLHLREIVNQCDFVQYRLKVGKGDLKIFWWTGLKVPMANQISEFLKPLFQERWGQAASYFAF